MAAWKIGSRRRCRGLGWFDGDRQPELFQAPHEPPLHQFPLPLVEDVQLTAIKTGNLVIQ